MNAPPPAIPTERSLREARDQASRLLNDLRSNIRGRVVAAAERLRTLEPFADLPSDVLFARRGSIQRKHALAVIAREWGYASWAELKAELATAPAPPPSS